MQKHEVFVGVDVSKDKLDLSVLLRDNRQVLYHAVYENNKKGIGRMLVELKRKTRTGSSAWLFCLEHTGVYAMPLCYFLSEKEVDYALIAASVIQRSIGLKRGKNDKADAQDIARYACVHEAEIKLYRLPEKVLMKLGLLLSHRERLMKARKMFLTASKEIGGFIDAALTKEMTRDSQSLIKTLDKKIKQVDDLIQSLIEADETMRNAYHLITSVPGAGPQIACYLLVYTRCFTAFENARQLACYAGIAPFEYSSGSSIKGRSRVSHLANKKLKSLFSLGALNAKKTDKELRLYYERKVAEGKNGMLVMNAIRNKLVGRIVATVKRGTPYVQTMNFAA